MVIEIRKNRRENFGRLIRRFNNAVQRSQILTTAKKSFHREKKLTKRQHKEAALRQIGIEKIKREY